MTVTEVTYTEQLNHLSAQLDIMNHSLYITNNYITFIAVVIALIGSIAMFSLGYKITKK